MRKFCEKYFSGFTIIGIVGAIGKASDIKNGAETLISLGTHLNITYDLFYNFCIALGIVAFCYALSQIIPFLYKNKDFFKTEPDFPIKDTLKYIVDESIYGSDLFYNDWGIKKIHHALKDCVMSGHIKIFATSDMNAIHKRIKPKELQKYELKLYCLPVSGSDEIVAICYIATNDNDETLVYESLFFSKKQIKNKFKPK
jgi:hypothetical protein